MTKYIDLTHELSNGMLKYPSDSEPTIVTIPSSLDIIEGVTRYRSGRQNINTNNHHGTHIDAPAHKIPGGKKITDYPISKFINHCLTMDLTGTDVLKRREISLNDVRNSNLELITDLKALIVYTGFCDMMMQYQYLTGQAKADFESKFPYFSQEAAYFIVEKFPRLNIIGIDSFALDKQGSNSEIHRIFFAGDILPLETLVGLYQIQPRNFSFTLHSVPIKIQGGDASQVRAYAEMQ